MSFVVPGKNLNFKYKSCSVVLNNIGHLKSLSAKELRKSIDQLEAAAIVKQEPTDVESEVETFEFEEAEGPLPPLYLLRDEGNEKWVLLNDLLTFLKVKSKDAALKQVCTKLLKDLSFF